MFLNLLGLKLLHALCILSEFTPDPDSKFFDGGHGSAPFHGDD
jgi:hypothetical protein